MDEPAAVVAAGYDEVADAYAALEQEGQEWPRARWLTDLVTRLPAGARILDLGCGNGEPVVRDLLARGMDVVGIDVSPEQVQRARAAFPSADLRVGDMRTADLDADSFDAVVSLYALEHVPRDDHAAVLARVERLLRRGGLLLLATEDADEPGRVGEWLGAPMYFSTRPADRMLGLVSEAGLRVLDARVEPQVERDVDVPYLWVLAEKHQTS